MADVYNPYIFIPLITWFIAQLVKFAKNAWLGNVDFRLLYNSGGMPSAHSAVVIALAVTSLMLDGFSSAIFGFAAVFATVVIYDSFGVRHSVGEQAVLLNRIVHSQPKIFADIKVREVLGHTRGEVIAGSLLGLACSLVMTNSRWAHRLAFLTGFPETEEQYVYGFLFGILIAGSFVISSRIAKKGGRAKTLRGLKRALRWSVRTPALLGLLLVFLQQQGAPSPYIWRLWPILLLAAIVSLQFYLSRSWYTRITAKLATERELSQKRPLSQKRDFKLSD